MQRTPKPLSFSAKTGAFMRGMLKKGPMVEIAIRGLSTDLPDQEAEAYAQRLISKSTTADIHGLLTSGAIVPWKAQEVFAEKLLKDCYDGKGDEGYAQMAESALCSGCVGSEKAQEALASMLSFVIRKRMHQNNGARSPEPLSVMESGAITSRIVEEHLAWCVNNMGDCEQALAIFKLRPLARAAQGHLAVLITKNGDAMQAYEALLSGHATEPEVQRMFASRIAEDGTPAMARTALMGNFATDPDAVITLKRALRQ